MVVLVLVAAAGVLGSMAPAPSTGASSPPPPPPAKVTVPDVNWTFIGTTDCFGSLKGAGTQAIAGETFVVSISLNFTAAKNSSDACTVETETVATTGFTFERANTPLVVHSGVPATLNVTVLAPESPVTSGLTLVGNLTNSTGIQATTVNVTAVHWAFSGSTGCFDSATTDGTQVGGGAMFAVSVNLTYTAAKGGPSTCTIRSETVATSGFTFVSANTPLVIESGNTQTLNVVVQAPSKNVTSSLTLEGEVSAPRTTTTVHISGVNWDFSGASNCWGELTGNGTVATGGQNFTVTIALNYTPGLIDPNTCTVQSVSVGTAGFTFETANTPLVVDSGSTQLLSVTCQAPDTNETTVLTIDGQDTSP